MNHLLRVTPRLLTKPQSRSTRKRDWCRRCGRRLVDFKAGPGWGHWRPIWGRVSTRPTARPTSQPEDPPGPCRWRGTWRRSRSAAPSWRRWTAARWIPTSTPLNAAARQMTIAENAAIFHGLGDAGMEGIAGARATIRSRLGNNGFERLPEHIAKAIEVIPPAGVEGLLPGRAQSRVLHRRGRKRRARRLPAAVAHPQDPRRVAAVRWSGRPDSTVSWSPACAAATSFESGQDLSIGYEPRRGQVNLYIEESHLPGRHARRRRSPCRSSGHRVPVLCRYAAQSGFSRVRCGSSRPVRRRRRGARSRLAGTPGQDLLTRPGARILRIAISS